MTSPLSLPTADQRLLGPAFDTLASGLALVGAPPAVGKTCVSLNLAVHYAAHLGEAVLYFSPGTPKEVVLARLAKNITPEGEPVDVDIVNGLPLVVLDAPNPTSAEISSKPRRPTSSSTISRRSCWSTTSRTCAAAVRS